MKKYILPAIMCFAFLAGQAQQINKELIYGKWALYSMRMEDLSNKNSMTIDLDKDSMLQAAKEMIHARRESSPKNKVSPEDSLNLINQLKDMYSKLFLTYIEFDKDGKTTMLIGFEKDGEGNGS